MPAARCVRTVCKRGEHNPGLRAIAHVLPAVAAILSLASPASGQTQYKFEVIARTGMALQGSGNIEGTGSITDLGTGPSINDASKVAFVAKDAAGINGRIIVLNNGTIERNYLTAPTERIGTDVQINNSDSVVWWYRVEDLNSALYRDTSIIRFDLPVEQADAWIGKASYWFDADFKTLHPCASLNNNGGVVFGADLKSGGTVLAFEDDSCEPEPDAMSGHIISSTPLVPMVSDDNKTVVRQGTEHDPKLFLYTDATFNSALIIATSPEFSRIGARPAISDDGRVVVFMGEHSTLGTGIFYAIVDPPSASLPKFHLVDIPSGSNLDLRVGVNHTSGRTPDDYRIVFLANDASGMRSLCAVDLNIGDRSNPYIWDSAVLARRGGTIGNFVITVDDIDIYDPVNNSGQIVFWIKTLAGTQAIIRAKPIRARLVPNYNRDSTIDEQDCAVLDTAQPFRFWINDDNDENVNSGDDRPGASQPDWGSDSDGVRDLVDFFPVWVDIQDALAVFPASGFEYRLCHSDAAFNALLLTDLNAGEADRYLKDSTLWESIKKVEPKLIDSDGILLPEAFLQTIQERNECVILLEGRSKTQEPLRLEISSQHDDQVIVEAQMPVSISGVGDMFRHRNLRPAAGGTGGAPNRLTEPCNYPDSLTIDRHFVFIHGYSVPWDDAYGSQCEVFKRMYWSGSNARFHGVTWFGEHSRFPLVGVTPNYWVNVLHAFDTADALAKYLNDLEGDVVVAAHSLGNVLASAAIALKKAKVSHYMIINGAVAMEAYDPSLPSEWDMVNSEWDDYIFNGTDDHLLASEWYQLFEPDDPRSTLTWRGLFSDMHGAKVRNYYSTGDRVVGNIKHDSGKWVDALLGYQWGLQEKLKGRFLALTEGTWAGWGFNEDDYWLHGCQPSTVEAKMIPRETLVHRPFFRKVPSELFSEDEVTAQEYAKKHRYELLAYAIPGRTFAIGANPSRVFYGVDMQSWVAEDKWCEGELELQWGHSSFKNVAYLYTYPMYDDMVLYGELK